MKALILANVGNGHFLDNELLPSCFLPLFNDMNVLERQISLLNLNGYANEDICVLFGSKGLWELSSVKRRIDNIGTKKIFSEKNNCLCEGIFDLDFFKDENVLVIEGNRVFDIAVLSRLKRYSNSDIMVVNQLDYPDDTDHVIELSGNRIKSITDCEMMRFPWIAFSGVAQLSSETILKLRDVVRAPISFLDAIGEIVNSKVIRTIDYDDLIYGRLNGGHSDELVGGSYAKLNYRLVVKKTGSGDGRAKVINEIKWLQNLPVDIKPYFSEVLEFDIDSDEVYFNVPYYGSRNLREHIFDGHFDSSAAVCFIENLLDWMFKNVYSRTVSKAPKDWAHKKHVRRVLDRLVECADKSEIYKDIVNADKLVINGVEYRNIREIFTEIENNEEFLATVNPDELVMIHGDLHFQNILVYKDNDEGFMLVDPRGELDGSDLYYDMGKLWHSFHAKYDFIHSDQFKFNIRKEDGKDGVIYANYEITNKYLVKVYDDIYRKFLKMIRKYDRLMDDPYWEMKALFAEAAHLCSVSTFHIGKTSDAERSVVMYMIGVQLINEFHDKYLKDDKWKIKG